MNTSRKGKAPVVCLCGSTKHKELFEITRRKFTLEGYIVLDTGGVYGHVDEDIDMSSDVKVMLDQLHLQRIDMADEIYIINPERRIGLSTCNELIYALYNNKRVRFLSPPLHWEETEAEFKRRCL